MLNMNVSKRLFRAPPGALRARRFVARRMFAGPAIVSTCFGPSALFLHWPWYFVLASKHQRSGLISTALAAPTFFAPSLFVRICSSLTCDGLDGLCDATYVSPKKMTKCVVFSVFDTKSSVGFTNKGFDRQRTRCQRKNCL